MDNYQFCANFARSHLNPGDSVLDYGCGQGQIVSLLLQDGINAYGCDVFYEGSKDPKPHDLIAKGIIKEMNKGVPFNDATFDLILNNQVMEHVPDLDATLAEIRRVLKPGGLVLSLFPDKSVWREGHCGVPFIHWLTGKPRYCYAIFMRSIGFGRFKREKSVSKWAYDFCSWLDKWTYYRTYADIEGCYQKHFSALHHIEHQWLDARKRLPLPAALKRWFVRKMAGLVFIVRK